MTHPAWLSTTWQIYSHDDDTQASYYGAEKAAESVHVQMNLPNRHVAVKHTAKHQLKVHVYNPSAHVVLSTKLTLVDAADQRILPAYYSDNYLNLAPHESRDITISAQSSSNLSDARVKMRGWNVETQVLNVSADDGTTRNSR